LYLFCTLWVFDQNAEKTFALQISAACSSFPDFNNHEMEDKPYGEVPEKDELPGEVSRCEQRNH
jgi:hypothetical protein